MTFKIRLPQAEALLEAAGKGPEPAASASGAENTLVVEDAVLALATEILRERGDTVPVWRDGTSHLLFEPIARRGSRGHSVCPSYAPRPSVPDDPQERGAKRGGCRDRAPRALPAVSVVHDDR